MQTQTNDYGVTIEGDGAGIDVKDTGGSGANFRLESDGGNLELHSGYGGSSTKMAELNYEFVKIRINADSAASDTWGENGEGYVVLWIPTGLNYTVEGVDLAVDDDVTGDDTNYMTLSLVNKGTDGAGTTEIISKAYTSGVDIAHFDNDDVASGGISNADIDAGEVLAFKKAVASSGFTFPGGLLTLKLKLRTA